MSKGRVKVGDVLHHWPACWCSGCAAWPEIQPCQSQACGSSSGLACTSPVEQQMQTHTHIYTQKYDEFIIGYF